MHSADWRAVNQFWFEEIETKKWFAKDTEFDQLLRDRFFEIHKQASCCELYYWRESIEGRVAEIIVLDQFSRNMFRGCAKAFAQDPLALALAQEAIRDPNLKSLSPALKGFLFMPFMHSESAVIHTIAMKLFAAPGLETHLEYEILHKEIIDRFGRYPHRNEILGRESTADEIEFLKEAKTAF